MQTALNLSAALLGEAGLPHRTAMCSAPCAAVVMALFAVVSAPGLLFGPWLLRRLLDGRQGDAAGCERLATRAAKLLLGGAFGWALGHGSWMRLAVLRGWTRSQR
ncbi:MAG: hypothetical protein M3Y32_05485 [Pseudomonadota bacterium]|nr:hypothetical protein [Pseudomonadota bacterium]